MSATLTSTPAADGYRMPPGESTGALGLLDGVAGGRASADNSGARGPRRRASGRGGPHSSPSRCRRPEIWVGHDVVETAKHICGGGNLRVLIGRQTRRRGAGGAVRTGGASSPSQRAKRGFARRIRSRPRDRYVLAGMANRHRAAACRCRNARPRLNGLGRARRWPPGVVPDCLGEMTPVRQRAAVDDRLDCLGGPTVYRCGAIEFEIAKSHGRRSILSARSASTALTADHSCQRWSSAL